MVAVDHAYSSKLVRENKIMNAAHTIAEWREEARENGEFLQEILSQNYYHSDSKKILSLFFLGGNSTFPQLQEPIETPLKNNYDIDKDLIVFLHIQKTGGMYLNERFRTNLKLDFPCNCKNVPCGCLNKHHRMWMYTSAFSGWTCGLHADWTQMHSCIPQLADKVDKEHRERRYFYMTQLRDPLDRYISEWNHQTRGGHWQDSFYMCAGKHTEWVNIRPCFLTDNWRGVSLDEFMKCKYNLATNRMARMLADLELSDCYKHFHEERYKSIRAPQWVSSAKANLRSMEYFGIMEEPEKSDKLFNKVYSLEFKSKSVGKTTGSVQSRLTKQQFLKLIQLTELDMHIYRFAQDLFNQRLNN
ncbi:H6S3B-like protein [Mya arenaria]|uniref:Heparan-sulfate 6-O-sulfotransferase n=3 Tax=Mya arenaria TaxID=6604 RepID=A0ABY7EPZ4_MYAAR|nr:heparan-sulfate 6-O-sulfotransferase 3-B-like isoform X2 [Mya arenaria]WAR10876.1 H6S3B-like protein [Mya arenaria]